MEKPSEVDRNFRILTLQDHLTHAKPLFTPTYPIPLPWAPGQCGVRPLTRSVPCGNVRQPR